MSAFSRRSFIKQSVAAGLFTGLSAKSYNAVFAAEPPSEQPVSDSDAPPADPRPPRTQRLISLTPAEWSSCLLCRHRLTRRQLSFRRRSLARRQTSLSSCVT